MDSSKLAVLALQGMSLCGMFGVESYKVICPMWGGFFNKIWNCFLGYIKNFQVHDPHRVGRITVELQGRVTDCRAVTFRQDVKAKEIEKYRLRTLPTNQWGYVVITTPDGVLDHEEALRRNVGGQVLGYFH